MRILLASPGLAMGGAERVVLQLATGLVGRGHDVIVSGPSGPLEEEATALGVGRIVLPERGRSPVGAAAAVAVLGREIRRSRPHVVHGHNVKASALAAMGARIATPRHRPRLVATFHGVVPGEYRAAAALLRSSDVVACVSTELADGLRAAGFPDHRLRVVHNAVGAPVPLSAARRAQLDAELGLGGAPVVLAVGRLVEQKNHLRLLDAAARTRASGVRARYLIAGEGPLRAALERRSAQLGLADDVRFLGLRRDVDALMARADVLIFSSDWEGLSIAALEGLAAGTPIVTTPVEGMQALLGEREAGVLAPDMTPGSLAACLVSLLSDPARSAEMGRVGAALVRSSFSLEAMLDRYQELYADRSGLQTKSQAGRQPADSEG